MTNQNTQLQSAIINEAAEAAPTQENASGQQPANTGKSKRKRNNGYENWKKKVESRGFKIIDKRFRQRIELYPGIISQNSPLCGQITVTVKFQAILFYKAMKMALDRWSLGVGYQELRSLRGLNGLSGTTSDGECLKYTAQVLTICMASLLNCANSQSNFGVYLQNVGLGELVLPSMFMDVLEMYLSHMKVHHPSYLEGASLFFEVRELNTVNGKGSDVLEEFGKALEKFGQFNTPFMTVYNYLARFTQLTSLMTTSTVNCYDLSVSTSVHTFNGYCMKGEEKYDNIFYLGRNVTVKDILLLSILNIYVEKSDLKNYHLDGYIYNVPENKMIVGVKRAMLSMYFGIEDAFISPTTTAQSQDVSIADITGITVI